MSKINLPKQITIEDIQLHPQFDAEHENPAMAAEIVRRYNAHEQLRAALGALLICENSGRKSDQPKIAQARAALAASGE